MILDHSILMVHVMVYVVWVHCILIEPRVVRRCPVTCPPELSPWASGAVLLKQLDSSREVAGNSLPPAEAVAREIEQHFASYSPEAKVVTQKSELRDSWDAFFGKASEKKRPDESFNVSSRWG